MAFGPDDALLTIYRARYPYRWMADALELEILEQEIRATYGVAMRDIWHDRLTLGELFGQIQAR